MRFVVFSTLLCLATSTRAQESFDAQARVTEALEAMRPIAMTRDKVDWNLIEQRARDLAKPAGDTIDLLPAYHWIVWSLGDNHSLILPTAEQVDEWIRRNGRDRYLPQPSRTTPRSGPDARCDPAPATTTPHPDHPARSSDASQPPLATSEIRLRSFMQRSPLAEHSGNPARAPQAFEILVSAEVARLEAEREGALLAGDDRYDDLSGDRSSSDAGNGLTSDTRLYVARPLTANVDRTVDDRTQDILDRTGLSRGWIEIDRAVLGVEPNARAAMTSIAARLAVVYQVAGCSTSSI